MKVCVICKNKFNQNSNNQKYCSLDCRKKIRKEQKKIYDKIYHKKYYQICKEQLKKYREQTKEHKRLYDINYKQKNKSKRNKYEMEKRNRDINYKLKCYLRARVNNALKGNPKLSTTMKLVGCSIEQLKKHLEKQFKKGMNWNNWGEWHVDHIKPCCSFDFSKISEQAKCFHYSNLQPLWAEENLRKHSKIVEGDLFQPYC